MYTTSTQLTIFELFGHLGSGITTVSLLGFYAYICGIHHVPYCDKIILDIAITAKQLPVLATTITLAIVYVLGLLISTKAHRTLCHKDSESYLPPEDSPSWPGRREMLNAMNRIFRFYNLKIECPNSDKPGHGWTADEKTIFPPRELFLQMLNMTGSKSAFLYQSPAFSRLLCGTSLAMLFTAFLYAITVWMASLAMVLGMPESWLGYVTSYSGHSESPVPFFFICLIMYVFSMVTGCIILLEGKRHFKKHVGRARFAIIAYAAELSDRH